MATQDGGWSQKDYDHVHSGVMSMESLSDEAKALWERAYRRALAADRDADMDSEEMVPVRVVMELQNANLFLMAWGGGGVGMPRE